MAISKIQKGDNVKVIAGNYKGATGVVSEVLTITKGNKTVKRVVVSSIPTIVKYKKGNKAFEVAGQQLSTTRKINISNVMLVNSKGETSRSKIAISDAGKKSRTLLKGLETVTKVELPKKSKATKELTETKE
jgi:ribosomal protein L24